MLYSQYIYLVLSIITFTYVVYTSMDLRGLDVRKPADTGHITAEARHVAFVSEDLSICPSYCALPKGSVEHCVRYDEA